MNRGGTGFDLISPVFRFGPCASSPWFLSAARTDAGLGIGAAGFGIGRSRRGAFFAILHIQTVTNEEQLRAKLRKITALFEGAATAGERQAAAAAIERIRQALNSAVKTEVLPETKFSMADQWQRRLFSALCRRYGLEPYRYKGQRYTTVMVRAPRSFVDRTLWPEYIELQAALHAYLNEATQRIIREEVYRDAGEAAERTG
jgi:hypothetical protein